jgi:hypothetical protein
MKTCPGTRNVGNSNQVPQRLIGLLKSGALLSRRNVNPLLSSHGNVLSSARLSFALFVVATLATLLPTPTLASIHLGSANPASLSNGLVGYWPLDGAVTNWNTNTTADLSGNGQTGYFANMSTTTSPVAGKIGQALQFDGSTNYVDAQMLLDPFEEQLSGKELARCRTMWPGPFPVPPHENCS